MEKEEMNILLVDDHKVVRDGIRYMIESREEIEAKIDEAEDGEEAVKKAGVFPYDLIIMDINMPDVDGIEATRQIINKNKKAKILALSMHDEESFITNMIKAGASGYILKNIGAEELSGAIRKITGGDKYYSSDVALKLMGPYHDDIVDRKPRPSKDVPKEILSSREIEILKMIANEMTNEEIAKKLEISKRTVDSHRQNILNKLQAKNVAGLIKYAIEQKYV